MCKAIKRFIKLFDFFSVPFSFRYKNENNYSTFIGGLFFILFCILALIFGINAFLPFCRRENFSLYFNTINLEEPEGINFFGSEEFMAINLVCDNDTSKLKDFFEIKVKYIDNNNKNNSKNISNTICNETYFYKNNTEKFNDSYMVCPNISSINKVINGTHKKGNFSYYEILIVSKKKDDETLNDIDQFLLEDDCKVELYFTDIKMDFNEYTDPIKSFINEIFLQLNPELYVKMNTFFVNQSFEDENSLFHEFGKSKTSNRIAYSRNEQYSLKKVIKNGEKKRDKPEQYAKIYIRADTKKIQIKRKYPNLMEFYADTFSFWVAIFYLLYLLFYVFNNFYAQISLEKNLFLFKGIENKYFKDSQKSEQIERLININNRLLNNNNNPQEEVRHFPRHRSRRALHLLEQNSTEEQLNERENANNRDIIQNIQRNEEENIKKVKYSFNIFELMCMCKCCICRSKQLKRKKNLLTEASEFLDQKLDIIFYIRNMIFLDKINEMFLGDDKKGTKKLLITPIICGKEEKEERKSNFYEHYCDDDLNNYEDEITQLNNNPNMGEIEKKIITLSNEQMKKMKDLN